MIKKLFTEFYSLGYKPGIRPSGLSDILVGENIIARTTDIGVKVHYLMNGTCIYIPWEWIDLFSSLNTHSGDRIFNINKIKKDDKISLTIYYFTKLVIYLQTQNSSYFLPTLAKICSNKTNDFRDWLFETYGYSLPGIEFSSLDKYITI